MSRKFGRKGTEKKITYGLFVHLQPCLRNKTTFGFTKRGEYAAIEQVSCHNSTTLMDMKTLPCDVFDRESSPLGLLETKVGFLAWKPEALPYSMVA